MHAERQRSVVVLFKRYSVIEVFRVFRIDREDGVAAKIEALPDFALRYLDRKAIGFFEDVLRKFLGQTVLGGYDVA
jgi:hypothetical protein